MSKNATETKTTNKSTAAASTEIIAKNFKAMLNKTYEVRIDEQPVTEGGLNCIGGWKATLKTASEEVAFDEKALAEIRYEKGDYLLDDAKGKGRTVAFYTMRKVSPRL
ncbi:hypothetical protein [Sansalvadorimonas verongulae]|uniref:hypothetical protein n=1 Tax=Sansalvadorimonas verongulae TaxID=2172824 RepID=UPI0012BC19A0|nr:hypothetical protein [Sansalvadorimonas verongulae]MTI11957.1 hypothetical protein [Sansalvadorimonas verongulae]MTI12179.1 hypothetical protein [Sansalvadorimonas verongulae]